MEINVHYLNLDSTPSLDTYIEKKVSSLAKLIFALDPEDTAELQLELGRTTRHHHKGEVYKVTARLKLPRKVVRADHRHENVRAALDLVKDTLHTSLERYKGLVKDKKKSK